MASGPGITPGSDTSTAAFLLSNFHCPTCIPAIIEALQGHHLKLVSPNLVTSVVTVEHDATVSIGSLMFSLEEAGFEVCSMRTFAPADRTINGLAKEASSQDLAQSDSSRWAIPPDSVRKDSRVRAQLAKVHFQHCEKCRTCPPNSLNGERSFEKRAFTTYETPVKTRKAAESDRYTNAVVLNEAPLGARWRASVSVGGMTCAVCVNAITDALNKLDWISEAVVNLVTNSANVVLEDADKVDLLIEAIEDLGYEATLNSVVSLGEQKPFTREREVNVLLEGVYCEQCPIRVARSLDGFRRQIKSVSHPDGQRSIMKITYTPEAPTFTVRHILAAIEASDPTLTATIYHPPTLEERSRQIIRHHQLQLLYRVVMTGIICIPTFILGIVYMSLVPDRDTSKQYLIAPWTSGISRGQIALFIMATPVYFFAADIFHVRALKEIQLMWRRGSKTPIMRRFYRFGSMNTLVSFGTTIAYVSSVAQLIAAGASHTDQVNNSSFYFDSVVFLTFFLLIGRLIESMSKARTGDAVEELGNLRPTTAILVARKNTDKEEDSVIAADLLEFGDVVRVVHGASPPADGIVVQGESNFNESSLTGESRSLKKKSGDEVFSGTVNKDAPVMVQITGVAGKSMLDQVINVVREGQTKRAPIEQSADVLTTYFVPLINLVAVLTWLIWMALGLSGKIPHDWLDVSSGGWVAWSLQFATAVFVVACPCGLALAAPTAVFVGGGIAAKHGILAKGGGEGFEKASNIDSVVFDKTGTLTVGGDLGVTSSEIYIDSDRVANFLAVVKAVEENSSHPVAKAIVGFCASRTLDSINLDQVEEIPGRGMKATYLGSTAECSFEILVGNEALMTAYSVPLSTDAAAHLRQWKADAKSIALAAIKPAQTLSGPMPLTYALAAAFSISDPIRPEAGTIIRALYDRGTEVWLLSGDNATTAAAVACQLGISSDNVIAGVLPMEKAEKISYLQSSLKKRIGLTSESTTRRATIAMVGDGINDAPALTTADVGIAIGSGSDVAINSADFVLLNSDLQSVVTLLDLSQAVFRRIKFNFGWALVYNCIAVPVAAGCLYPIVSNGSHVRLNPVWASLAMALSSISVVTSSLALRSQMPGLGFRARTLSEASSAA